jgi:hypothetical protein
MLDIHLHFRSMDVQKCRDPSLRLATKARGCKVTSQREANSHAACSWECKRVCGNRPSHSQRNSHFGSWSPTFSKHDFRGQNPSHWKVIYIIGNILKLRCLKSACMTHLDIWNTSYGQKKGHESNWQFDFWPLKVRNRPDFLAWKWCATCRWKALNEGYNFGLDLVSIRGLHTKLWSTKVVGVPTLAISGLPFRSPKTKNYLDEGLAKRCRVYYMGEGGGFPQIRAVMILWVRGRPWFVLAPKML